MSVDSFYSQLGLPEACLLDKRLFKRMLLEYGQLTRGDKKSLSEDVGRITWKYTLKDSTVQVLPYEDGEREYLEVAVVEVLLSCRRRTPRIAKMIQRAIPYPVLLVMVEGSAFCVNVAHKRLSLVKKDSIVAERSLSSPWIGQPLSSLDQALCRALALSSLSQVDFYALYRGMVNAVLARLCAEFTGTFAFDARQPEQGRGRLLEQCHGMKRQLSKLRAAIRDQNRFADKVELNTRIKELEARLLQAKAEL